MGKRFGLVEVILSLVADVSIPAWLILFQQLCHLRLQFQHFQQPKRYRAGLHSEGRLLVENSGITGGIAFSQNQFLMEEKKGGLWTMNNCQDLHVLDTGTHYSEIIPTKNSSVHKRCI